jgi:hypothetical protein
MVCSCSLVVPRLYDVRPEKRWILVAEMVCLKSRTNNPILACSSIPFRWIESKLAHGQYLPKCKINISKPNLCQFILIQYRVSDTDSEISCCDCYTSHIDWRTWYESSFNCFSDFLLLEGLYWGIHGNCWFITFSTRWIILSLGDVVIQHIN